MKFIQREFTIENQLIKSLISKFKRFIYYLLLKKNIILYIIEKCNSILSCRYHNDFQHDIVVMKASIKPWRQGLEPRLKGHRYASLSRREKLKTWWGLYIELLTEFCGGHNNLVTHLYTSFSQLSPLKNLVVGYCIRLT